MGLEAVTPGRWIGIAGIQLAVVAFIGAFGTVIPQQDAVLRIASQLFVIPLVVGAAYVARRRRATSVDGVAVACLGLYVVVSLASADVTVSVQTVGMVGAWVLLFVVMADVAQRPRVRRSVALAVAGVVTAWLVIFAITWLTEKITWIGLGGGIPNLFESTRSIIWLTVNVVPTLALLGAGFLAYVAPGRGRTVLAFLFLAAASITVPMSGGRAGWLGAAVAGGLFIVLGSWKLPTTPTIRKPPVLAAAAVAVSIVIVGLVTSGESVFTMSGLSARWPLWDQALRIAAAEPATGGGPGTFAWLRLVHVDDYATPVGAILAHNVLLQTVADGGLLLGVGLVLVVGAVARAVWRARHTLSLAARCGTAALGGFAITSLLDDHSGLPAVTAMVVTLGAWIVSEADSGRSGSPRFPGWGLPAAGVIALAIALPFVVRVDLARHEAQQGRRAAVSEDFAEAAARFGSAARLHPENALYHLEAGLAHALVGDRSSAMAQFTAAAERSPGDPRPLGALADLSEDRNDRLALLTRAAQRAGDDPRYSYRLGMELLNEDVAAAHTAFARAVSMQPTLLHRLADTIGREQALDVVTRTRELAPEIAEGLRLDLGALTDDLALFDGAEVSSPAHAAVASWHAGDEAAAVEQLFVGAEERPYDVRTWEAAAHIAHDRCDAEEYRRTSRLAFWSLGGFRTLRAGETLRESLDLAYREVGLGRYQPADVDRGHFTFEWPAGIVGEPTTCPGWDDATLRDPFN